MSSVEQNATSTAPTFGNVPKFSRFTTGVRRWWPYYVMLAPGLIFFLI